MLQPMRRGGPIILTLTMIVVVVQLTGRAVGLMFDQDVAVLTQSNNSNSIKILDGAAFCLHLLSLRALHPFHPFSHSFFEQHVQHRVFLVHTLLLEHLYSYVSIIRRWQPQKQV